jgi:hypothetical protein
MATVHDTNYEYFAQDDFRVRKPDIKIKVGFGLVFVQQSRCMRVHPKVSRLSHNETYSYNSKHSLRSNTKGYGGKTH